MLLKPISILLLLSLLAVNASSLLVFIGFEANQTYIAKELCENKDKPEMHCNGKCYLMKKLRQAQDKEQKQEHQTQKPQVQEALLVDPLVFRQFVLNEIKFHIPYSTGMPQNIKNSIFHPPQLT